MLSRNPKVHGETEVQEAKVHCQSVPLTELLSNGFGCQTAESNCPNYCNEGQTKAKKQKAKGFISMGVKAHLVGLRSHYLFTYYYLSHFVSCAHILLSLRLGTRWLCPNMITVCMLTNLHVCIVLYTRSLYNTSNQAV